MEQQITDKIEKKLQEVPHVEAIRSYSKPGESLVFFTLNDSAPPATVEDTWYQVRKRIGDVRHTLPSGIQGPFFNDEFGETFGNIYALSGEGFSYADLKKYADRIRQALLRVPDVAKVEFFGEQDEKVFIELSNAAPRSRRSSNRSAPSCPPAICSRPAARLRTAPRASDR